MLSKQYDELITSNLEWKKKLKILNSVVPQGNVLGPILSIFFKQMTPE